MKLNFMSELKNFSTEYSLINFKSYQFKKWKTHAYIRNSSKQLYLGNISEKNMFV